MVTEAEKEHPGDEIEEGPVTRAIILKSNSWYWDALLHTSFSVSFDQFLFTIKMFYLPPSRDTLSPIRILSGLWSSHNTPKNVLPFSTLLR